MLSWALGFLCRVSTSLLNTVVCGLMKQWEMSSALQLYCTITPQEQCKGLME